MDALSLTTGIVSIVSEAFKLYAAILGLPTSLNSQWSLLSSRMFIERARLETTVQQLARANLDASSDLKTLVVSLLSEMTDSLKTAASLANGADPRRGSISAVLKFRVREDEWKEAVHKTTEMNNQLELIAGILARRSDFKSETNDDAGRSGPAPFQEPVIDEILNSLHNLTGESPESVGQRLKATEPSLPQEDSPHREKEPSGLGESEPMFAEVSNCFQLWSHAVESEGLYDAIDHVLQDPRNIQRQSLGRLLLQSEVRIGEVLMWWQREVGIASADGEWRTLLDQCAFAVTSARADASWLPVFKPSDIKDTPGEMDGLAEIVLKTVERLVDTLANCLPSIVDFCRQNQSINITASDVTDLLEISVELIKPASEALSKAATRAMAENSSMDGAKVDYGHIQSVFEKQAMELQKWKAKHGQDIETKLAENNPAKLATAADAVGNIATLLVELPKSLGMKDSQGQTGQTLGSMMKSFETYIESLTSLDHQLNSIEPPPMYMKSAGDRIIIDLAGNIRAA